MKKLWFAIVLAQLCGLQLFAQESSVKILLNEEERFRFDSIRLAFINPLNNIYIGDSAGSFGSEAHDNISIGLFAGSQPGKSYDNIFIGRFAGMSDTSGFNNVYLGYRCGLMSRSGVNNIFIGFESGHDNVDGSYNTFIGSYCGRNNTTGSINTFIGRRAGHKNTTGAENTFIGQGAGHENESGNCNTFLGRFAGGYNNGGDSNVFLGYTAGMWDTASQRLIIANTDTPNPLIYGEFDNHILRFNTGRIEIRNQLENIIIGDSSGTQGYGNHNVIIGNRAGKYITGGNQNTFIGTQAGYSDTTGSDNVFVGMQSGYSNTTGYRNTFVGISSGATNTTGMRNTFVGLSAGAYNSTGSYNTYVGRAAGYYNQTGDSNVFIGSSAGMNEMGSAKLYISNSDDAEPLIYGDFAQKKLIFHADSVQTTGVVYSSGEIRTDQQFNAAGNPGITDTVNTISDIDFSQQKFRYRTTVYSGGIATFISLESEWVDDVGEYLLPCGDSVTVPCSH
jgi:hypothetical protein